jgi:dienelactone hydrolase
MRIVSEVPQGVAQAPGVVVIMHGPGLDRFVEDRVAELTRHGYAAAAPDLYHRQPADDVDTMTRVGRLRDDENAERYRPDQAREAWQRALEFLARHLKA